MGITGLLPLVKNACRTGNIIELKNQSVALDVSCLLHKGLVGCMDRIHLGEETSSYIGYVEKYVTALLAIGCHVIMVFDGRPLPAKKGTNDDRRDIRARNVRDAEILMAKGKEKEARNKFRLATKISTEVVQKTIKHFSEMPLVDVIVSPYEADAQLAYLVKANLCDAVVTEDSDLIVFGCEKIFFKWQIGNGECTVYEKANLPNCFSAPFGGAAFDFVKFRRMCILSGCDYLQAGLPGVGLAGAQKVFAKASGNDLSRTLRKIPIYLNNTKLRSKITRDFIESFIRAEETFLYQVVFDPKERCQKTLNSILAREDVVEDVQMSQTSTSSDDFDVLLDDDLNISTSTITETVIEKVKSYEFAGVVVDQRTAVRLALGNQADQPSLTDLFLPPNDNLTWSVWSDKYERKSTKRAEMEEKAAKAPIKSCGGAFVVEGPGAKKVKKKITTPTVTRKRVAEDDLEVILEQVMEPELKEEKLEKKEDLRDENVINSCQKKKVKLVAQEGQGSSTPPPPMKKVASSPAKFVSPLFSSTNCLNNSQELPKLKKSTYFERKASVSNPFRKAIFVSKKEAENEDENVAERKKENQFGESELLVAAGEAPATKEDTIPPSTFYFAGFKGAGLRRRTTK